MKAAAVTRRAPLVSLLVSALGLALWAAIPQPAAAQTRDACALLAARPGWAPALKAAAGEWDVRPGAILAVIDQESRFRADARGAGAGGPNPARNFGFAQANLRTWAWYARETRPRGEPVPPRTDFAESARFVGWHFATMSRRLGIARDDVVRQYLVYKMGEGGYRRGAPASARQVAARVARNAAAHDRMLAGCGFAQPAMSSE